MHHTHNIPFISEDCAIHLLVNGIWLLLLLCCLIVLTLIVCRLLNYNQI